MTMVKFVGAKFSPWLERVRVSDGGLREWGRVHILSKIGVKCNISIPQGVLMLFTLIFNI